MHNTLIKELEERAECYFAEELVWTKMMAGGAKLFLFDEEEHTAQFVRECKALKTKGKFTYESVKFEIQLNKRYVRLS